MASVGREISKLFVGNLPWTVGHRELRGYFQEFGKVLAASVVFDKKSGCSKGYGFVTVSGKSFLENIEKKQKHILEGSSINIQTASDKI